MMATDETNPEDWYTLASERLRAADILFGTLGATPSTIELLQESVERYLKEWLIGKGWQLIRTHDLRALIRYATAYDERFLQLEAFAESLTDQFFAQHYPGSDLAELGADYVELRQDTDKLLTLIGLNPPERKTSS